MRLDPKHVTFNNLLLGRLFRIPDYQRAYAWGPKQRADLFSDVLEVQRSGQDHFMATVVCLARDKRRIAADEYQAVDVVDGQQRLTTFIVLLKAIEKALSDGNEREAKIKREINELLVKGDSHSLVLLQTNHDSSNVFLKYIREDKIISNEVKTAADNNLVEAMEDCESFVKRWIQGNSLVDLVAILRHSLSVIYHELIDEAAVYRIFEVLNSRGLDVKWIDKLKSQLMALIFTHADGGARADALKEMQVVWQDIYRTLGLRGDLGDQALRFAGTWVVKAQPNRLLSQEDAVSAVVSAAGEQLNTIAAMADWMKSVVTAVNKLSEDVRLRAVTRVLHARFVATAILLRQFSKETERRLLGQWERVTFRIFGLGGADTRYKVGDYVRLGYDMVAKQLSEKDCSERIKALGDGYSIEEVLEDMDWSQSYEGWTEELRYMLFRYDEYLARRAGEKINEGQWNKIWEADPSKSIEHIQPQHSGREYVHHLGNLTMLSPGINSSLKDKDPNAKAEVYKRCGLRGTMSVGGLIERDGWSKNTVLTRAAEIEQFIRQEWAD